MSLQTKIRQLREKKDWSQMETAYKLDISQSAYNKWEAGQAKPTLENLQKLAEIFGVDFFDLINEQFPNIDLSNAKFENSQCLVFDSTINNQNTDLLPKMIENQIQITKLIENQNKLMDVFLKNKK